MSNAFTRRLAEAHLNDAERRTAETLDVLLAMGFHPTDDVYVRVTDARANIVEALKLLREQCDADVEGA